MSRSSSVSRLASLALLTAAAGAAAAEPNRPPLLQSIGGESWPASLVALDASMITVASIDGSRPPEALGAERLYRWGEPAPLTRRPTVVLHGGSRVVAAPTWTLEGSVRLQGDRLTVRQTLLDDAAFPRRAVRAIDFAAAADRALYAREADEIRSYRGSEDRVWLTSGDAFTGKAAGIESGRLAFESSGEPLEFSLADVVGVVFGGDPEQAEPPAVAVGLRDGGLLLARSAQLDPSNALTIELPGGVRLTGSRQKAVALIQPLGGRVAYLSDLSPIDYRHTPYFGGAWPYGRDRNLRGEGMSAGGRRWLKGLAVHSAARLVYRVPQPAERFETGVAIDASASSSLAGGVGGSVVFRVLVARGGRFAPAATTPVVRRGDDPLRVSVDVRGAQAIALMVEYADAGSVLDHADWLDARFVSEVPAPTAGR